MNGSNASITEFPFQAALRTPDGFQYCGGVIVGVRKVITAAHCVYDLPALGFNAEQVTTPGDVFVFAGSADLKSTDPAVKKIPASAISFDPQYDPDTNDYDVAVITLSDDLWNPSYPADPAIDGTNVIAPVPMLSDDAAFTADLNAAPAIIATVSGWGCTSPVPAGSVSCTDPFPALLKSAQVPLVAQSTCQTDYAPDTTITDRQFCAGEAGSDAGSNHDSCFGDSGGPIVLGSTPSHYVLAGLVDSGDGCAAPGFPGIYDRVTNPALQAFLTATDLPQAPQQISPTTVTGGSEPGDSLACAPGTWTPTGDSSPSFDYQFLARGSSTVLTTSAIYKITEADRGKRIYCRVKATNEGGYGFGESDSVLVPVPITAPPPTTGNSPPPPPADPVAPRLRVTSKKCTLSKCTIKVRVTDAAPSSGIARLMATLRWTKRLKCKKSRKSAAAAKTCTRQVRRKLKPKAGRNGTFTIVADDLFPRTHYSFALLPFDKAGNKPQFSTITTVRTKARRRGQLLD